MAASAATNVNVGGQGGDPERVLAALVTANTYDVLGVPPRLGRAFRAEDEAAGAAPVAILTDAFWRRRLGANPAVVGTFIPINGVPTQIVGVVRHGVVLPFEIGAANPWMSCCR